MFSEGIEMEYWHKIGYAINRFEEVILASKYVSYKINRSEN